MTNASDSSITLPGAEIADFQNTCALFFFFGKDMAAFLPQKINLQPEILCSHVVSSLRTDRLIQD